MPQSTPLAKNATLKQTLLFFCMFLSNFRCDSGNSFSNLLFLSTSNSSGFEQLRGTKLCITGFHVLQAGVVEQQQEGLLDMRMQVARSQPKPSS